MHLIVCSVWNIDRVLVCFNQATINGNVGSTELASILSSTYKRVIAAKCGGDESKKQWDVKAYHRNVTV